MKAPLLSVELRSWLAPRSRHTYCFVQRIEQRACAYSTATSSHRVTRTATAKTIPIHESLERAGLLNRTLTDGEFYDFYLNLTPSPRDNVRPPRASLQALDASACRNALPERLRDDPLQALQTGTQDLGAVRQCLEAYIAIRSDTSSAKAARNKRYRSDKPGTRALHWLFSSQYYKSLDFLFDVKFTDLLVHCLVAEGREDFIWSWFENEHTTAFAPGTQAGKWKGVLLREMLESQAYWSTGPNMLEEPLRSYFRAWPPRSAPRRESPKLIAPHNAGEWLIVQLNSTTSIGDHVLQAAHSKFVRSLTWMADPDRRTLTESRLMLYRQSGSDPSLAYQFLRHCANDTGRSVYIRNFIQPSSRPSGWSLVWYIINTAQALDKHGAGEQARWVLKFGRQLMPEFFHSGRFPNTMPESGGIWSGLKWQAEEEINQGSKYAQMHRLRYLERAKGRIPS